MMYCGTVRRTCSSASHCVFVARGNLGWRTLLFHRMGQHSLRPNIRTDNPTRVYIKYQPYWKCFWDTLAVLICFIYSFLSFYELIVFIWFTHCYSAKCETHSIQGRAWRLFIDHSVEQRDISRIPAPRPRQHHCLRMCDTRGRNVCCSRERVLWLAASNETRSLVGYRAHCFLNVRNRKVAVLTHDECVPRPILYPRNVCSKFNVRTRSLRKCCL